MREDNCLIEVINDDGSINVNAYDCAPSVSAPKAELPHGWEDQLYEEWRDRRLMESETAEVGT